MDARRITTGPFISCLQGHAIWIASTKEKIAIVPADESYCLPNVASWPVQLIA